MINCSKCGYQENDSSSFCSECGNAILRKSIEAPTQSQSKIEAQTLNLKESENSTFKVKNISALFKTFLRPKNSYLWLFYLILPLFFIGKHFFVDSNISPENFRGEWLCGNKNSLKTVEIFDGNSWLFKGENIEQRGIFLINGNELIRKNISTTLIWEDIAERNVEIRKFISIGAMDVAQEIAATGQYLRKMEMEIHATIKFESPKTFFEDYTLILEDGKVKNNSALSGVTGVRCDRTN